MFFFLNFWFLKTKSTLQKYLIIHWCLFIQEMLNFELWRSIAARWSSKKKSVWTDKNRNSIGFGCFSTFSWSQNFFFFLFFSVFPNNYQNNQINHYRFETNQKQTTQKFFCWPYSSTYNMDSWGKKRPGAEKRCSSPNTFVFRRHSRKLSMWCNFSRRPSAVPTI